MSVKDVIIGLGFDYKSERIRALEFAIETYINKQWIGVNENPPCEGDIVLVWRQKEGENKGGWSVCIYKKKFTWNFKRELVFVNIMSKGMICNDVTYWMYMPRPPKKLN